MTDLTLCPALRIESEGSDFILTAEQWVNRPTSELFSFFSREENLEMLTPPFLGFKVLGKNTPEIEEGTLIRYRLRVHGIPIGWTTRIEEWTPGARFIDRQLKGPYSLWHHTHTFEASGDGTLMKDRVRFRLPLGLVGKLFGGWLVKKDVTAIFQFRRQTIEALFR
jgi:uncharacterized protein